MKDELEKIFGIEYPIYLKTNRNIESRESHAKRWRIFTSQRAIKNTN